MFYIICITTTTALNHLCIMTNTSHNKLFHTASPSRTVVHASDSTLNFRDRKRCLYLCSCFVRRDESPIPGSHDDYVNREVLRDYANRDSLCDDYGDDYANREAIREAQRERERERQALEYREYVNAPSTWQQDSGDDNRNTQRRREPLS